MCKNVFICGTSSKASQDEETYKRAEKLEEEAASHCVFCKTDAESVFASLWARNGTVLASFASSFIDDDYGDEEATSPEYKYIEWVLKQENRLRHKLGDAMGYAEWRDYKTKSLEATVNEIIKDYNKLIDGKSYSYSLDEFKKKLKPINNEITAVIDKKYLAATSVYESINSTYRGVVDEIGRRAAASLARDRERQAREDAINRRL